jgi:hypothetical protein
MPLVNSILAKQAVDHNILRDLTPFSQFADDLDAALSGEADDLRPAGRVHRHSRSQVAPPYCERLALMQLHLLLHRSPQKPAAHFGAVTRKPRFEGTGPLNVMMAENFKIFKNPMTLTTKTPSL